MDHNDRATSRTSLDSHEAVQNETNILDKFRTKVASIVRGSLSMECDHSVTDSGVSAVEEEGEEEECNNKSNESVQNNISFTPPESPSEYRILSRSESAGDANIIDKLQNNSRKACSRSLHFTDEYDEQNRSPGK